MADPMKRFNLRRFKLEEKLSRLTVNELVNILLDCGFLVQSDLMEHLKDCHDKVKK